MNITTFNLLLLLGWGLVVLGLALVSVPLALVVGGAVMMGVTLALAFRAGVMPNRSEKG